MQGSHGGVHLEELRLHSHWTSALLLRWFFSLQLLATKIAADFSDDWSPVQPNFLVASCRGPKSSHTVRTNLPALVTLQVCCEGGVEEEEDVRSWGGFEEQQRLSELLTVSACSFKQNSSCWYEASSYKLVKHPLRVCVCVCVCIREIASKISWSLRKLLLLSFSLHFIQCLFLYIVQCIFVCIFLSTE